MTPDEILNYCLAHLEGTVLVESWGERGIFYNPGRVLKRGVYVLTVKEKDGENDKASQLDRPGVFRVNAGPGKAAFQTLFGPPPKRPPAGGVVDMPVDFTKTDELLPHPVYAWMGWVCVLNPSAAAFDAFKPLIDQAYQQAKKKFQKRKDKV